MIYFISVIISLFVLVLILSIPSFIAIYKMGIDSYFFNIKTIMILSNGFEKCYHIKSNKNIQFTYKDGSKGRLIKSKETDYFYPIYLTDKIYLINEKIGTFSYGTKVTIYDNFNNKWTSKEINISNIECIYTMFFYNKFSNRMKKLKKISTMISNVESLESIINEYYKLVNRERKINLIFHE